MCGILLPVRIYPCGKEYPSTSVVGILLKKGGEGRKDGVKITSSYIGYSSFQIFPLEDLDKSNRYKTRSDSVP